MAFPRMQVFWHHIMQIERRSSLSDSGLASFLLGFDSLEAMGQVMGQSAQSGAL